MSATTDAKSAVMLNSPARTAGGPATAYSGHAYKVEINDSTTEGAMNITAAENIAGNKNDQGICGLKHDPYVILGTVKVNGNSIRA